MLLSFALGQEGVHLHTRRTVKLFNLVYLRAKTKVGTAVIRKMMFADDAAQTMQTKHDLQKLISQPCL